MAHKTIRFAPVLRKVPPTTAVTLRWSRDEIANFLDVLMHDRDVTVAELAEAADLSQPTIYKMLRAEHKRSPELLTFLKCARALGAGVLVIADQGAKFKVNLEDW